MCMDVRQVCEDVLTEHGELNGSFLGIIMFL